MYVLLQYFTRLPNIATSDHFNWPQYITVLHKKIKNQKNLKSMGWPFLICLAKVMQHIIFYAHVHACVPAILAKNIKHCSRSETVRLWLVDHSFDRAVKALCCL